MCADPRLRTCAVARYRRARGQALVEAVVAAIALVPFALLIVWLGKVQTIQQATVAASRMLAFECAARPQECGHGDAHPELVDELRRRAFSRTDVQPLTEDRVADEAPAAERNPLWVDRANRPLIERFADIGARIDRDGFDAGFSVATSRPQAPGNVVELLSELAGPGRFGCPGPLARHGGTGAEQVLESDRRSVPGPLGRSQQAARARRPRGPAALHR